MAFQDLNGDLFTVSYQPPVGDKLSVPLACRCSTTVSSQTTTFVQKYNSMFCPRPQDNGFNDKISNIQIQILVHKP